MSVNIFFSEGALGNLNDRIVECTQHINKPIQTENVKM